MCASCCPAELQLLDPQENWAFLSWLMDERRLQFIEKVSTCRAVSRWLNCSGSRCQPILTLPSSMHVPCWLCALDYLATSYAGMQALMNSGLAAMALTLSLSHQLL
jgi:hypothetical protein